MSSGLNQYHDPLFSNFKFFNENNTNLKDMLNSIREFHNITNGINQENEKLIEESCLRLNKLKMPIEQFCKIFSAISQVEFLDEIWRLKTISIYVKHMKSNI